VPSASVQSKKNSGVSAFNCSLAVSALCIFLSLNL
jgi:hypothetical protein